MTPTDLAWSDSLVLGVPEMDLTHEELVHLLAQARVALRDGDAVVAQRQVERLLKHTADHFAQEEEWMHATGCPTAERHVEQHASVLRLMQTVDAAMREGRQRAIVARAIDELSRWLPNHAKGLDADLARHMEAVGYTIAPTERSRRLRETAGPLERGPSSSSS